MADPSIPAPSNLISDANISIEDKTLLLLAGLMEGGQEDEVTCKELNTLTRLLTEDSSDQARPSEPHKPLCELIDADSVETILGYLDMRQSQTVRGHATLTTSAYLKASGQKGVDYLSEFFYSQVRRGTYDDLILAFSVAASIFPIVPDVIATLFLSDGFVNSLGPLMQRKWKSKKVEKAALEMLSAACMNTPCREAVQKYCTEWLEEIVANTPETAADVSSPDRRAVFEDGSIQQRIHSGEVRNLAAVILAKLQAVSSASVAGEGVQPAVTSIEDLSDMFKSMLSTSTSQQSSIEGLAYASLQPKVKERLSSDKSFLVKLIKALNDAPAKSPATYGALTVLVNLTNYMPSLSDEQKRLTQLKAYANASKPSSKPDPLNDDEHVTKRCQAVFEAGIIPILVTHSQHGSVASLTLVVSIIFSLSKISKVRGQIAQQGGVKLLLHAYSVFPTENIAARRTAAHALARILISTNPLHVFGGSNPLPLTSAIRPLVLLLTDDPTVEHRDLLPVFESLLALTNLASTDDSARNPIIRIAWMQIEELFLSNNTMVSRATVELICNLMQSPEGVAKFADGSKQASHRMHILLALADAEDFGTRRAAGGALASLTEWDTAVNAILERDRGVGILLALCTEDGEELRHRGVVCILNILTAPHKVGEWGVKKVTEEGGVEVLKECLKKSRSQEVLEITVEALKKLLADSTQSTVKSIKRPPNSRWRTSQSFQSQTTLLPALHLQTTCQLVIFTPTMPFRNLYRLASDSCIEPTAPRRTVDAGNAFDNVLEYDIDFEEWDNWLQWDGTEAPQSPLPGRKISSASSISESGVWDAAIEEAGDKSMSSSFENDCSFDHAPLIKFEDPCQSTTLELTPEPRPQQNLPTSGGYAILTKAEEQTLLDIAMPCHILTQVKISSDLTSPTASITPDSAPPTPILEIQSQKSGKRKRPTNNGATTLGPFESRKRGHNAIEKRYRTNLNNKINSLRLGIPSLCKQNGDGNDSEEVLEQKYGKATILTRASEYIKTLQGGNERLGNELAELKTRVAAFERLAKSGSFSKFKN
ncbi:hypothetical protein B7494_g7745 [Chlorociboria aeruginascens]|nr:hypothetical protein B7494_g7745 [Chlorociboria aeruginascens]